MNNMDDVTALVTAPFQDLVSKSKTALENAGELQAMIQAANNLMKEGQRAITRLEPICQRYWEDHGVLFVALLKENEELAKYRKLMIGLLWEFDDYITAEEFDVDRFSELQALSRDLAPRIYDVLLTFKFDNSSRLGSLAVVDGSPPISPFTTSPASFSSLAIAGAPARGGNRRMRDSASSGWTTNSSGSGFRNAGDEFGHMMSKVDSLPAISGSVSSQSVWRASPQPHLGAEGDGRAPSAIPWDGDPHLKPDALGLVDLKAQEAKQLQEARQFQESKQFQEAKPIQDGTQLPRRPRQKPPGDRPALPPLPPSANIGPIPYPRRNVSLPRVPGPGFDNRRSGVVLGPLMGEGADPNHTMGPEASAALEGVLVMPNPRRPIPNRGPLPNRGPDTTPMRKPPPPRDPFHGMVMSGDPMFSPISRGRSPSITESLIDPDPFPITSANAASFNDRISTLFPDVILQGFPSPPAMRTFELSASEAAISEEPPELEKGEEKQEETPYFSSHLTDAACIIDESSSYHTFKGLCPGAREIASGAIGIRKSKRAGTLTTAATVAKCKHCLYEFDYRQLELDLNRTKEGSFTEHDVSYRVRFLQKSHLPSKRLDDVMYACIFCIHSGRTIDPSDATVFTSTSALFLHIARHPRPLPPVPGVTVVEASNVPAELQHNYDICFNKEPAKHPCRDRSAELSLLPSGTAKDGIGRMATLKLPPPDRAPLMELVVGAQIIGITWPDHYHGEWCVGWHDGVHAVVPCDIVKLDPPDWDEMGRLGSRSAIKGKAKWKFGPKENKKDWLRFEEGELITNITWFRFEHWCWTGTNSKGKWGAFPQAFLDMSSLQDPGPGSSGSGSGAAHSSRDSFDRQSVIGNGSLKTPSLFGKMKGKWRAASDQVSNNVFEDQMGYWSTR